MSIPEVPGTSAPLAATTAPPPSVVPASSTIVGGGMPGSFFTYSSSIPVMPSSIPVLHQELEVGLV